MHSLGNRLQPFGTVEYRIKTRDIRKQRLRRADVRGRLFSADVLLTGLKRQAISRVPLRIDGNTDDSSGHVALVSPTTGHIRRRGATVAHGHAKALRRTNGNVGAHSAGFLEQR